MIAFLAAALLIVAVPLAASAQGNEPPAAGAAEELRSELLAKTKERVIEQINRRLILLDRLAEKVGDEEHITAEHAQSLLTHYDSADTILVAGIEDIAATESLSELREVARSVFEDTLVLALQKPRTRAVNASDHAEVIGRRSDALAARLQQALDDLAAAGVDTTEAHAALDQARALVDEAIAAGSPVADTVIDLTPSDDFIGPLTEARTALKNARSKMAEARGLTRGVAAFIHDNRQIGFG